MYKSILNKICIFPEQEDAKSLRECISYYLLTYPCNEKYDTLVEIKKILNMHVSSSVDISLAHFLNLF